MKIIAQAALLAGLVTMTAGAQTPTNATAAPAPRPDTQAPPLSIENRAKIEAANKDYQTVAGPLSERLAAKRKSLEEAVNARPADEAGIRARAREAAEIEADLAIARAHRLAKLREFLSEDQVRRYSVGYAPVDRRNQPVPQRRAPAPTRNPARTGAKTE